MVTRSIVGRFLILAVLLVSLGVIAQAALIISREPGHSAVRADAARGAAAVAALAASPANAATSATNAAAPAQTAEAAPVRVVYPGPLGDAPVQTRKITDAAPASPVTPPPAAAIQTAADVAAPSPTLPQVTAPQPVEAAPAAPAAASPAPVVMASADTDSQPATEEAGSGRGVNLNSASIEALNHLGGGHIGQSIVKHRPYHSVEDLVKKRVVRRSVYEQIKNQLAAK